MSSKMSEAQRRRAQFGIGGTRRTGELARDNARTPGFSDRQDNLNRHAEYTTPARLEELRVLGLTHRANWLAQLSLEAGREITGLRGGQNIIHDQRGEHR